MVSIFWANKHVLCFKQNTSPVVSQASAAEKARTGGAGGGLTLFRASVRALFSGRAICFEKSHCAFRSHSVLLTHGLPPFPVHFTVKAREEGAFIGARKIFTRNNPETFKEGKKEKAQEGKCMAVMVAVLVVGQTSDRLESE